MEPLDRLEAGIAQARPIIAGAQRSDFGKPTPCTDWNAGELINHMLGALTMFRDAAVDGSVDPALFTRDLVGDDAVASFDKVAAEALAAWREPGRAEGMANLPFGEMPAPFALQLPAMDMVVHGWDLAQATGQQVDWNGPLVDETLEFVLSTFNDPAMRGDDFGPAVPVPDDAPAIDRVVGYLGRQP